MKILPLVVLLASLCASLQAQTIDDGIMMGKHDLFTGFLYSHDSWDQYWEGTLKRVNGNIGTITTQTNAWFANYALTDRLNLMATVPYVWTHPSQGVLQGQKGLQDITLAGKYSFIERSPGKHGTLRAIAVLSGGFPLSDYTPDFLPLSIGSQSQHIDGRFTLNYQSNPGWYLNGSMAYTRRADVTLDRPYYFTDNQFFFTSVVTMADVADYVVSAGYLKHGLNANLSYSQQFTQGGGDIRRQDAPFVSNRMNFSKLGGMVMTPLPKLQNLAFQLAVAYTVDGRNVGQATTFTTGLFYTYHVYGSRTR
jgi:hypothetical protein